MLRPMSQPAVLGGPVQLELERWILPGAALPQRSQGSVQVHLPLPSQRGDLRVFVEVKMFFLQTSRSCS